jgi:hypothetical protein
MTLPSLSHDWPPEDELPAVASTPAPLPDPTEPLSWVRYLLAQLERRRSEVAVFDDYYEGIQPLNFDEEFRAAFGRRWARFASNYSALVVDRLVDRLEVQGFRFADATGDADLWDIWQANDLDGASAMAHTEALIKRGAYALVEPSADALPRITVEDPFDAITAPDPRDRRRRLAGLKRWIDEQGHLVVYLYLPEWVASLRSRSPIPSDWTAWLEPKASWPDTAALEPWSPAGGEPLVRNPLGVVPLVPLRNRPRLRGVGRSEIEPVTSNQDAINYFRAMTVVGARFLAYPQRVLLNVMPEVDPTTGLAKKPFKAGMQQIWMIEPPDPDDLSPFEPKVESFAAADLTPLLRLVEGEVRAMAAVAGMPYELLLGQTSLLPESGEAKKSGEAALVQKLARIQVSLGEDWEIVMRTALRAMGDPRAESLRAETRWRSTETRNEAVRTDSVVKQVSAGLIDAETAREQLGYSVEQIARMRDRDVERQARDPQARMAELVEAVGGVEQARSFLEAIAEREATTEAAPAPTGPRMSPTNTAQNDR